ncbi:hypothetical protein E8E13_006593 [Curvularia kusanoi]|uniref:UBC core domain-containing protein n=1 Tax=Curvularia kusanoi TaxID=90978 RepID=A0A9P4W5L7_CURKU|nr:hypothetical protein E8E13_006593 [Curvularia kusanoi]
MSSKGPNDTRDRSASPDQTKDEDIDHKYAMGLSAMLNANAGDHAEAATSTAATFSAAAAAAMAAKLRADRKARRDADLELAVRMQYGIEHLTDQVALRTLFPSLPNTSGPSGAGRPREGVSNSEDVIIETADFEALNLRSLWDFQNYIKASACVKCGYRLFERESDPTRLFMRWFDEKPERFTLLECGNCRAPFCTANSSSKSSITFGNKSASWCCESEYLLLIWILLYGFDLCYWEVERRSAQGAKKQAVGPLTTPAYEGKGKGKAQSYQSNGTGYGGNEDIEQYVSATAHTPSEFDDSWKPYEDIMLSIPSYAQHKLNATRKNSGRTGLGRVDSSGNSENVDPRIALDKVALTVLRFLQYLLPSLDRGLSFDMHPSAMLTDMLLESRILDYCANLLINDSLDDVASRYVVYNVVLDFVKVIGMHPTTANLTVFSRRPEQPESCNLLSKAYHNDRVTTDVMVPSIAENLQSLSKLGDLLLENAKHQAMIYNNKGDQDLLSLCRKISGLQNTLSLSAHVSTQNPEVVPAALSTGSVANVDGVADDHIYASHSFKTKAQKQARSAPGRFKRLVHELSMLKSSLPSNIFVRHGEARLDVIKSIIIGPKGTPYENGLFEFDIYCPSEYPNVPPSVSFKEDVPPLWKDVVDQHFKSNADDVLRIVIEWSKQSKCDKPPSAKFTEYLGANQGHGMGYHEILPELHKRLQMYGATVVLPEETAEPEPKKPRIEGSKAKNYQSLFGSGPPDEVLALEQQFVLGFNSQYIGKNNYTPKNKDTPKSQEKGKDNELPSLIPDNSSMMSTSLPSIGGYSGRGVHHASNSFRGRGRGQALGAGPSGIPLPPSGFPPGYPSGFPPGYPSGFPPGYPSGFPSNPLSAANSIPKLESLPEELLQLIISHLKTADLKRAALSSRTLHRHANGYLWQHVCLVDKRRSRLSDDFDDLLRPGGNGIDEHDDTPIIQKLYILARNPSLAANVQTLTHRCHLPTPNIFSELPRMYFDASTLSTDVRLHKLLTRAIRNLVNVHTLRIVYGHWHLVTALITGLLRFDRPREVPLQKLWIESCAFDIRNFDFLGDGNGDGAATGLESIRMRRLRFEPAIATNKHDMAWLDMRLARGGHWYQFHNGAGGWVGTTVEFSEKDLPLQFYVPTPEAMTAVGQAFDNMIWKELWEVSHYVHTLPMDSLLPPSPPRSPFQWLFHSSQSTLTRLDLDWVLWRQREYDDMYDGSKDFLQELAAMRFPHLVAFQMRNAVMPLTALPHDISLLEDTFLTFMEEHPKIKCLAWPLDKFYGHTRPSIETQGRCRRLIAHLAMILTDIRLDTYYIGSGEPKTDHGTSVEAAYQRIRRRRFIAEFAPHMRKIKQIKLEGGIPRDEKRELIRALHHCPLQKAVFIGVSFPAGNTWGAGGSHLIALDAGHTDFTWDLEEENTTAMFKAFRRCACITEPFTFTPEFGWHSGTPLLHTLSIHHAPTLEEIKICGYNGSPILSNLTPETTPLLAPLLQCHNLRQVVVSFWLLTFFEGAYRDAEIIQSWMDTRSPSSTALVVVTPPRSPEPDHPVDAAMMPDPEPTAPRPSFNRWAVALRTRFTPSALAYRVASDLGPFLSPVAKARDGGVRVRASFCLGAREERRVANDIFDLDIRIGRNDQVLEFVGPREEGETGRWWAKMEGRQWF